MNPTELQATLRRIGMPELLAAWVDNECHGCLEGDRKLYPTEYAQVVELADKWQDGLSRNGYSCGGLFIPHMTISEYAAALKSRLASAKAMAEQEEAAQAPQEPADADPAKTFL